MTAEDMDRIGSEVGLDPALMRQALGHLLAQEKARRFHIRQTILAIAACLLFLGAGAIWGFKLYWNAAVLRGSRPTETAAAPAWTPPRPMPRRRGYIDPAEAINT